MGKIFRGFPLIAAFRAVFSERYEALAGEIAAMKAGVAQDMGDAALARLGTIAEQIKGGVEFWQKYCAIRPLPSPTPTNQSGDPQLATGATGLLDRKAAVPLQNRSRRMKVSRSRALLMAAAAAIEAANTAIRAANVVIAIKKAARRCGRPQSGRNRAGTLDVCDPDPAPRGRVRRAQHTYTKLSGEKDGIEARKDAIRKQLDAHTKTVVKPYERHQRLSGRVQRRVGYLRYEKARLQT